MFWDLLLCGYTIAAVFSAVLKGAKLSHHTVGAMINALEVMLYSLTYFMWKSWRTENKELAFDGNPGTDWLVGL